MTSRPSPAAPDVQDLGEFALLGGAALVDVTRVLAVGLRVVAQRDGIAPPTRLVRAVAVLEVVAERTLRARAGSDAPDAADVRQRVGSEGSVSELVGTAQVAEDTGLSTRQAQRLIAKLGGTRNHAGHLRIDQRVLEQHLAEQEVST